MIDLFKASGVVSGAIRRFVVALFFMLGLVEYVTAWSFVIEARYPYALFLTVGSVCSLLTADFWHKR